MRTHLRRSIMTFDQQLAYRPLEQNRCGAYCMTCLRPSDEEQLVDEARGPRANWAKVLVRCHGAEELRMFEFGSEDWTYEDDLKRAMQRCAWFDPRQIGDVPGIPNNGVINAPEDDERWGK
jgi:hypothetical protein